LPELIHYHVLCACSHRYTKQAYTNTYQLTHSRRHVKQLE